MWLVTYQNEHRIFFDDLLRKSQKMSVPNRFYISGHEKIEKAYAFYEDGHMVFFIDKNLNYVALNDHYYHECLKIIFITKQLINFTWGKEIDLTISASETHFEVITKMLDELRNLSSISEIKMIKLQPQIDAEIETEEKYKISYELADPISIQDITLKGIYVVDKHSFTNVRDLFSRFTNCEIEEVEKNRDFILNELHRNTIARLSMIDRQIPVRFYNQLLFRGLAVNSGALKSFCDKLNEFGYKETDDYYNHNSEFKIQTFESQDQKYIINENQLSWSFVKHYDDKYNDESLAFYRHVIKRHIIKDFSKYTNCAYVYDRLGKSISINKIDFTPIPYITKNEFQKQIKIYQILEVVNKVMGKSVFESVYSFYLLPTIEKLVKYLSADKIAEILILQLTNADRTAAHDILYKIDIIVKKHSKLLTKKALEMILVKDDISLEFHIQQLSRLKSITGYSQKELRKIVSKGIKEKQNLRVVLDPIVMRSLSLFLKKKKIKDVDLYMDFVSRMSVYNGAISILDLFETFKGDTKNVVTGNIEGIFEPETFYPDTKMLGDVVKQSLQGRTKQTQKLYTKLNKIYPVSKLIDGEIPFALVTEIVEVLKQSGTSVKFSHLPLFYGKIEAKCSPEYLIAGDASKCCMGFGEEKAIDYALEKGFGIFNVYYNDLIIANSVLWINSELNMLVLDNVEVNGNYSRFEPYIKNLYNTMVEKTVVKYGLDGAIQGGNYNDVDLYNESDVFISIPKKMKDVYKSSVYTDAHVGHIIHTISENREAIIEKCLAASKNVASGWFEDDDDVITYALAV